MASFSCSKESFQDYLVTYDELFDLCDLDNRKRLGSGVSATAYKVIFNGKYACLKLGKCLEDQEAFDDEAAKLAELQGAGGAPLLYCVCHNFPAIVISFRGGTTLYNYFKNNYDLKLQTLLLIFLQVALNLEEIHQCGFTHNDLKADNVLIHEAEDALEVNVIDFGHSTKVGEHMGWDFTPEEHEDYPHYAPEVFLCGPCTPEGDVYSLGHMMFELLGSYFTQRKIPGPLHLIKLIDFMMNPERSRRPSILQVIQILEETVKQLLTNATPQADAQSEADVPSEDDVPSGASAPPEADAPSEADDPSENDALPRTYTMPQHDLPSVTDALSETDAPSMVDAPPVANSPSDTDVPPRGDTLAAGYSIKNMTKGLALHYVLYMALSCMYGNNYYPTYNAVE
nr:probable serine/threonine-protein kinase 2 [Cherax quadricarinatus]